jgi:uncharacterized membrane protein
MKILLIVSTILTGLAAGLLYAYSCSVNPGLGQLDAVAYLSAMQHINQAIQNPVFLISFLGSAILLPICSWSHFGRPVTTQFKLILAAAVLYITGVLGVTMLGNVPLNEMLASFDIQQATAQQVSSMRLQFETPWNTLHAVRTVVSVVCFVMLVVAGQRT